MSIVGQPERATQNRVIALFRNELRYRAPVRIETGQVTETVKLINWGRPSRTTSPSPRS